MRAVPETVTCSGPIYLPHKKKNWKRFSLDWCFRKKIWGTPKEQSHTKASANQPGREVTLPWGGKSGMY